MIQRHIDEKKNEGFFFFPLQLFGELLFSTLQVILLGTLIFVACQSEDTASLKTSLPTASRGESFIGKGDGHQII